MSDTLADRILAAAEAAAHPDGHPYRRLSAERVRSIAAEAGCAPSRVEGAALAAGVIPERYARNARLLAPSQQATLLAAHVAVVGLGGLGGTVVEILARLGVGRLTLIDGDRFDESNLNRQLLCTTRSLGDAKAETAARRVAEVNPAVAVHAVAAELTPANAPDLLAGAGVAVDCLDNLPARFALAAGARRRGIPMVSAAVGGASGQVTVIVPSGPGLESVYGPPAEAPRQGAEASLGTLPQTASAVAAIQCSEVLKLLLETGEALRGRLLLLDLMDNRFDVVEL